jgi:hypothetical protein
MTMADMKVTMGWMKYVEMLELAESRGVPAQFDAELCGMIAKAIKFKNAKVEAQTKEIKELRAALEFYATHKAYDGDYDLYIDQGKIAQAALTGESKWKKQ